MEVRGLTIQKKNGYNFIYLQVQLQKQLAASFIPSALSEDLSLTLWNLLSGKLKNFKD